MASYVNVHTHSILKSPDVISIRSFNIDEDPSPKDAPFSCGIHPWHIADSIGQLAKLETDLSRPGLVALGESGLDKLKGPDLALQTALFEQQVNLAEKHQLPLVIHCVKAYNELLYVKKRLKPTCSWLVHGFNGNPQLASQLADHGIYLSLGCAWLRKKEAFKQLLKTVPLPFILFETDESVPADVIKIYDLATTIYPDIKEKIHENALKVFPLLCRSDSFV